MNAVQQRGKEGHHLQTQMKSNIIKILTNNDDAITYLLTHCMSCDNEGFGLITFKLKANWNPFIVF